MATSRRFRVITKEGEHVASCKWPGQALLLVSRSGAGGKISHMDWGMLWREGEEQPCLGEHENVAKIRQRIEEKKAALRAKLEAARS